MNFPNNISLFFSSPFHREGLENLFMLMEAHNIQLLHPTFHKLFILSSEGERYSIDNIDTIVQNRHDIVFQVWLDADTDIICSLKAKASKNIFLEEYDLDGLTYDEKILFLSFIFRRLADCSKSNHFLGVVMDYKHYLYDALPFVF